jgi:hypothetical protein
MIVRTAPQSPAILALRLLEWQIVDGRELQAHESVLIELPIFIAIRAEPIAGVIVPFIGKAHCDTVSLKSPNLFDQAIVKFFRSLAFQKFENFLSSV